MNNRIYLVVLLGLMLTACQSSRHQPKVVAYTGTGILVIDQIDFAENLPIRKSVREECRLPEKLTSFIDQFAAEHYSQILTNTDISTVPAGTRVLKIKITDVKGFAGGAWSGGKSVSIAGTLLKDGKVLGDFKARRVSGGGMFAEFKGTCSILGRCVKSLARDVAKWLKTPTRNAVLSDF
jgi:hypothetical protein